MARMYESKGLNAPNTGATLAALVGLNRDNARNNTNAVNAFNTILDDRKQNMLNNAERESKANTGQILGEILEGKTPTLEGYYDSTAVAEGKRQYLQDQLHKQQVQQQMNIAKQRLALSQIANNRAGTAANRAATKFGWEKEDRQLDKENSKKIQDTLQKLLTPATAATPAPAKKPIVSNDIIQEPATNALANLDQTYNPSMMPQGSLVENVIANRTPESTVPMGGSDEDIMLAAARQAETNPILDTSIYSPVASITGGGSGRVDMGGLNEKTPQSTPNITPQSTNAEIAGYIAEPVKKAQQTFDTTVKNVNAIDNKLMSLNSLLGTARKQKDINSIKSAMNTLKMQRDKLTTNPKFTDAQNIVKMRSEQKASDALNKVNPKWKEEVKADSDKVRTETSLDPRFSTVKLSPKGVADTTQIEKIRDEYTKATKDFRNTSSDKMKNFEKLLVDSADRLDKGSLKGAKNIENDVIKAMKSAGIDPKTKGYKVLLDAGKQYVERGLQHDKEYYTSPAYKREYYRDKANTEYAVQANLKNRQSKYAEGSKRYKSLDDQIKRSKSKQADYKEKASYASEQMTETTKAKAEELKTKTNDLANKFTKSDAYTKILDNKNISQAQKRTDAFNTFMNQLRKDGIKIDIPTAKTAIAPYISMIPSDEQKLVGQGFTEGGYVSIPKLAKSFGDEWKRMSASDRTKLSGIVEDVHVADPKASLKDIIGAFRQSGLYDTSPFYTWRDNDKNDNVEINWSLRNKTDLITDMIKRRREEQSGLNK